MLVYELSSVLVHGRRRAILAQLEGGLVSRTEAITPTPDINESMMDRKRDTIDDLFLVKLFDILARDRVEMTATEVLERNKEKGQLITPVVGRQQSEMLGPMIEREVGILQRQGLLPPIPQALVEAGGSLDIEHDSLATRMQQADEISSYQRLVEIFTPQMQLDPSLAEVFNTEDAIR